MNTRRRTTVHDLAALRVHRDGSRVANSDTNRSSRRAKYTVPDARGNWVAKDAGGLGTVKLRRNASQPEDVQDGDEDEGGSEPEQMEEAGTSLKDKGKGRARESGDEDENEDEEDITVNTRAQKRRRFNDSFSYLSPEASPTLVSHPGDELAYSQKTGADSGTFPVPSSDLLKCLHYFASTYYTAMGQLHDASREFRQERKIRRARKPKKTGSTSSNHPRSEPKGVDDAQGSDGQDIEFSDYEEDEGEEDAGDTNAEDGEEDMKKGSGKNKRPRTTRRMTKDMYKLFDGSALMALGMLLQEHVAELLEPNVPEGWEKEFALAERHRKAEEKRAQKARKMWNKRHGVKPEDTEQPAPQSDEEVEGAPPPEREETDGEDVDEGDGQRHTSK